jgi:guanylate kinase
MEDWSNLPGKLIVVSGPSGSGKSTLARRALLRPEMRAKLSVSATTRAPRHGEKQGVDYFFLTREQFIARQDSFLEWAEVHGNLYGTPAEAVREAMAAGTCIMLEIDVQGALLVKKRVPSSVLIFISVPTIETLEARLRARGTDDEVTIGRRLANARWEMSQACFYDVQLLNWDLDQAVDDLVALLNQHGCGG